GELNINQFAGLYKLFNQIIRDIALEKKVILIDLDILVPKTDEFIIDTIHFNKAGSALVAESIIDTIIKKAEH
ncbi:SGNH/GDSL hydrolase family protein, partial [Gammaproteobacteria bacterium]|nr:SGNH/GDSL hydrolase family protein [Gammaproteobacteria bacterium]